MRKAASLVIFPESIVKGLTTEVVVASYTSNVFTSSYVSSWKKGTRRAAWVARGSGLGARGPDGFGAEALDRMGGTRIAAGRRAATQRVAGPDTERAGPRHRERESAGADTERRESGPKERRVPTQRASGPTERTAETQRALGHATGSAG